MPITAEDIKRRLNELIEVIKENGSELIKTKDGKTLEESSNELKEENEKLKKENEKLREELGELKKNIVTKEELERIFGGKQNFDENGVHKGSSMGLGSKPGEDGGKTDSENAEEKAWQKFFNDKEIADDDKENWKNSGLTSKEAYDAHNKKKWINLNDSEINVLGDKKISYTKHGYEASDIELLKHSRADLLKIFEQVESIKNKNEYVDLVTSYTDKIIENLVNYAVLPSSLNSDALKKIRDEQLPKLFKKAFNKVGDSSLSPEEIDKWRKESTGLPDTGTDQRKAFDNGWKVPSEIKKGKQNYQGSVIEVLIHVKGQIDIVNNLIGEINTKNSFGELDEWRDSKESEINQLDDSKLPEDNLTPEKARLLWNNNFEAGDIQDDGSGDIRAVHSQTNNNVDGYKNIIALGNKLDWDGSLSTPDVVPPSSNDQGENQEVSEELKTWRESMGGVAAGPRNKGLDGTGNTPADNVIMDAWFRKTKAGGGTILNANGKQKKNIEQFIAIRRSTFFYFLNEEKYGGGIDPGESQSAFDIINNEENFENLNLKIR